MKNEPTIVPEGSVAKFGVDLTASSGAPATPTEAFLSVECVTNGTVVQAEATLPPSSSLEVKILGAANAIIDRANPIEVKRAIVRTIDSDGDPFITTHDYIVRRVHPIVLA